MWVSSSRIVIGSLAGTRPIQWCPCASLESTATVLLANAGMKRETGSSRRTLPSSTSIMTPTLVTALLCEAMRNSVLDRIGEFRSRSAAPTTVRCASRPSRSTSITAPAILPLSTYSRSTRSIRASRSVESPKDSGLACGSWAACAGTAARINAIGPIHRLSLIAPPRWGMSPIIRSLRTSSRLGHRI